MESSDRASIARAFGITLRYLRLRDGVTQEALAHESGVDRGYLGELERGRYNPTLETIYRLLPHLKVGFAEFAEEFDRTLKRARRQGKP